SRALASPGDGWRSLATDGEASEGDMVIEFFGPSCAGKTSLLNGVSRVLAREDIHFENHDAERGWKSNWDFRTDLCRGLTDPYLAWWCVLNPAKASSRGGRCFIASV